MRLRNIKDANQKILNSNFVCDEARANKGKWNKIFENNNSIEIEIGMGKGDFIIARAKANPNSNFIGIEKYASVLLRATEKLTDEELPNLKLICIDALELEEVFEEEIAKIYLNFSDPWPKKRHAKRRLTSPNFIEIFKYISKQDLDLEMKTDNNDLFEYSLEQFKQFNIIASSRDYGMNTNNIFKTEYEKKFINKGIKINYIHVKNK